MSFPSSCGEDLGLPALKMHLLGKSCRETFVFPADYIRTAEQIPSAPCRMALVGVKQLLFHSFAGHYRLQDATVFKILRICLTTKDTCFPAEVWSVGRQAGGLNPGPCACWASILSLRGSPDLGHLIKIPLSLLSMSPLLTAM